MTSYTEARYNRLQHQIEQSGFVLDQLELDGPEPRAVYRRAPGATLPTVVVYATTQALSIVADTWEVELSMDVPGSVVQAALDAASAP